MALTTGRIALADDGEIYLLAFTPETGLSVAQAAAPAAAPAAAATRAAPAYLGEPQTLTDGTPLPAGIWEVEGGTVYAGYGGATIRQVVFGDG